MDSDNEDDDDMIFIIKYIFKNYNYFSIIKIIFQVNEMAAETLKNRKSAKPNGSTVTAAAVNSDDDF